MKVIKPLLNTIQNTQTVDYTLIQNTQADVFAVSGATVFVVSQHK